MQSRRLLLIVAIAGAAVSLGWLCRPMLGRVRSTPVGQLAGGPAVDPMKGHPHSLPPFRRQKTRPDPTPEDQAVPDVAHRSDEGPVSIAGEPTDSAVAWWLVASRFTAWSQPVPDELLYQLTHRIRC